MAKKISKPVKAAVKVPSSYYHTKDYLQDLPGLSEYPGKISFPKPFTFGDYKRWVRAVFDGTAEKEDETPFDTFMREYRAAYEVIARWELKGISKKDGAPENEDLPMEVPSFLTSAAEAYIGPKIIVQTVTQTMLRRMEDAHTEPEFDTADMLHMLPDLKTYPGKVTFAKQLTAKLYAAWNKAMVVKDEFDPGDVENSLIARQYRAALPLIDKWDVKSIERSKLTESGDNVPLVIVSFLTDSVDAYLGYRTAQKKLRIPSRTG